MNANILLPIGVVTAVVVMALTVSTRPFVQLDLWLDERDAPITAQANALSPLINCVNRVDVHWRVAYDSWKNPQPPEKHDMAWLTRPKYFDDSDAFNVRDIQRDVCSRSILEKLDILAWQPALQQKAFDLAGALDRVATVAPPGRYNREASFVADAANQAYVVGQNAAVMAVPDDYIVASTALRQTLLPLDAAQRPEQLKLLEARLGKDIHWYLLAYMIQARDTVDMLDAGMQNRTLTPQLLAQTTAQLQQAWDRREPFLVSTHDGFQTKTDAARDLWLHIGEPGTRYLDALKTLHKDWQNHAEPQRLSEDFYAVTRSYDGLLSHYNRRARGEF